MPVIAYGFALRLWVLASSLGAVDSDGAVIGLMAADILEGVFTTFYWGQAYQGSLSSLLTAPLFLLAGPTRIGLKAVPLLLNALSALLIWRIGRRTVGAWGGALAAALFWIWPPVYLWWATRWSSYWVVLCLGLIVVLAALRLGRSEGNLRSQLPDIAMLGAAAGLGWWSSPQIVYLAFPALAWLVIRDRGWLSKGWPAVPAAMLGSLPWLVFNVRHGFASFRVGPPFEPMSYFVDHLAALFTRGLPIAIGFRLPLSGSWLIPLPLGVLVYAVLLGGFLLAVMTISLRRPLGLLLLVAIMFPVVFAASPFSSWVMDGRYLLFLTPAVVLLIAHGLSFSSHRLNVSAAVFLLTMVWTTATLQLMEDRALGIHIAEGARVPHDFSGLIAGLKRNGIDEVFADYWVAYRLTFEADEEIIATPYNGAIRNEAYRQRVTRAETPAYVMISNSQMLEELTEALETTGAGYRLLRLEEFTVVVPDDRILPSDLDEVFG